MEEVKRQLASIQRVKSLKPIEGADKIEVAEILGWHVVVKKGEFQVGDLVVYCEVDSILPAMPETEFLAPKYRVKTVRLRGQISQGICFPLSILPIDDSHTVLKEGMDATEELGVIKYEPPTNAQLAGKIRGNFPGFLPKTDEVRLQAYPSLLERHQEKPFYVTEKLDGSSCTFYIKNDEFHACSRNIDFIEDPTQTIWRLAREMKIEEKMKEAGIADKIALQGEVVGEKIQKNTLNLKGQKIYFFNAYDFITGEYLSFQDFVDLFIKLDLPCVPLIDVNFKLLPTVDEMVAYATRKSVINPNGWAEGLVFRPKQEERGEKFGRLSFKVINPEFLLKNE